MSSGKGKEREITPGMIETRRAGPSNVRERLRAYQEPEEDSNATAGPSRLMSPFEGSSTLPPDEEEEDPAPVPEAECASKEEIIETLDFINRVAAHTAKIRMQIAEAQAQADAMRQHLAVLRQTKLMMRARRQRMQAFVEAYERQPRKLPYETLWGPKNGKLIVNTRATDDEHHKELWMSEKELESWGVDVSQIPDHKPSKERKRNRDEGEETERPGKRRKVELLQGLFEL